MDKTNNNRALIAHLSMFGACAGWGLMAPVGKDAMTHGFDGITMVTFRVVGACLLFWIASIFAPKEKVPLRDKLMFIGAGIFGLVLNQCCYTIGLSITSPINASIVTTSMPIFAMLLAALILKEPITGKKALGVPMGCSGALILILTSAAHASDKVGDIRGDLLCLFAQFSFALYLSLFNPRSAAITSSPSTSTCSRGLHYCSCPSPSPMSQMSCHSPSLPVHGGRSVMWFA